MKDAHHANPADDAAPYNVEIEQQLLGAIMLSNEVLSVLNGLEPEHFYDPVHRRIFDAIQARVMAGRLASPVTLKSDLEQDEGLKDLGGPRYLARLAGAAITRHAAPDFAHELRGLWARREVMRAAAEAMDAAGSGRTGISDVADNLERDVAKVVQAVESKPTSVSFLSAMVQAVQGLSEAYQGGTGRTGISTGLDDLDRVIGGLAPGRCYVLAGRPAMGKSAIALNVAAQAAMRGDGVFFASLEMPAWELSNRFFSQVLADRGIRLEYSRIERGDVNEDEFRAVLDAAKEFESLPLEIGDPAARSTSKVRAAALRAKARMGGNLRLIVIDYLQKLQPPNVTREFERISAASEFCKWLAVDMNVPVLALAQLSRQVETRDNKRPVLSDLRGSGEIEQDADVVMFAYRDAYYLEHAQKAATKAEDRLDLAELLERRRNDLEIITAKQRGGAPGVSLLHADLAVNAIRRHPSQDQGGFDV